MLLRFVIFSTFIFSLQISQAYLNAHRRAVLSLENIMAGDNWIGNQPGTPWWSVDSHKIYFHWNPDNNLSDLLYCYDLKTNQIEKVSSRNRRLLPVNVVYDNTRSRILYVLNGDLFIRNLEVSENQRLTSTLEMISSPSFTKDGKEISYVADNNFFIVDPESGKTRQITDFRQGSESFESPESRHDQWLEEQQIDLFLVLQEKKEKEMLGKEQREKDKPERPLNIYTGSSTVGNLQLSPGEKFVIYTLYERKDDKITLIPDFVSSSGYTEDSKARPNVGSSQISVSVGIYDLKRKKNYEIKKGDIPGLRDVPEYLREYGFEEEKLEEDREVIISGVFWSADGKKLAVRYSYFNKPWDLYIMDNKAGSEPKQITFSLSEEFKGYNWRIPELLKFSTEDGGEPWARLYRPDNPEPGGPAVIFVHGAGYLQNAHKWWSSYSREYMFHNLLADKGYTVFDIDYRGSAGYGRDWRTGIYRHMGGKDLSDNVDGARFLVENYDVDPSRIGIYGGSYGGFITLMAMFNHPGVFSAGTALRSVTDWAHYSHGYTSNILNTPVSDSLVCIRSSPIYFAEGLEGALLICHGMIDDNVHFQDIVMLSQRLIELGKKNWELAVYPVEGHSFTETSLGG